MSPDSFDYIQPLLWSILTLMPPSQMAFVTIFSTSTIIIVESKFNFDATSRDEIQEYQILMLQRQVLMTLYSRHIIILWVL